ncbi:RidA family protein [Prosthecomicrobium sp. N25]|uniref:RidA family protein n=1 Tax=Prosthecomicrobium sp. N25 TaxID=3129254 RepID=UPI0030786B5B
MAEIVKVKSNSKYEELIGYSRVVVAGDTIYVSNTAGRDYGTREIAPDAAGQARKALKNIEGALASVGAGFKDVVRFRGFVPDPADMEAVNAVYAEVFKGIDPACTWTCTPLAHHEMKVEFEVTAYRRRDPAAPEERRRITL